MRPPQKISGFTLLEVVVALLLMVSGLYISATLFKNSEYDALKARIDGRVAALLRNEVERTMCMPYANLFTLSGTGGSVRTGHLYHPAMSGTYGSLYPYTITSSMLRSGAGTNSEMVSVQTTIQWEEPPSDPSQAESVSKQVSAGTHSRRRY